MENNKNKNNQDGRKFHGLSSPQELIEMWRELRYDDDEDDINVIWDYMDPEDLQPGFNIVNIKYNPKAPTETGHYVLISVLPKDKPKEIEYFNPVAAHTKDDEDKPYWPMATQAVYKEIWGHTTGKYLWVLADICR